MEAAESNFSRWFLGDALEVHSVVGEHHPSVRTKVRTPNWTKV